MSDPPYRGGGIHVMTSSGGLIREEEFRAKDSLLSGPAGGVVGAVTVGKRNRKGKYHQF